MEPHFPMLLTRKKAMAFCGFGRKALENFASKKSVRTFVTEGGHKRYFRDDLAKHLNEQKEQQE